MNQYYISSTKFTIQERKTKKHGTVYDVVFRITDPDTLEPRQKKLSGFTTRKDAKAAHAEFITEHCELIKDLKSLRKQKQRVSTPAQQQSLKIGDIFPKYIAALANQNKPSTIYAKKTRFAKFVLPQFADTDLQDLTKRSLTEWQDWLWGQINPEDGEYYSHAYLKTTRGYFSAFLSWCSLRYDTPNHFDRIRTPKRRAPKDEMLFWERDEFETFIKAVEDPMYRALFYTLFFTGRRIGEVYVLQSDDVDLQRKSIAFSKSVSKNFGQASDTPYSITSTKADKVYDTNICDTLYNELTHFEGQTPFYFRGDRPLAHETVRRHFKEYIAKAGVKEIRLHDLRHSFVSMIIHLGAPLTVVADLIGDTLEQVTKTYGHLYASDRAEIIKRLG